MSDDETTAPRGSAARSRNRVRIRFVALAWGFAEATLFFVLPDVWISWVALRSTRDGLAASGWAVTGALIGGTVTYLFAQRDASVVLAVFDRLPAIGDALVARVAHELQAIGMLSVMIGPFTGAPYKLYAAQAPAAGIALWELLAISVPARGLRFVLVALVFSTVAEWALPRIGVTRVRAAWLVFWLLGYAWYWSVTPN